MKPHPPGDLHDTVRRALQEDIGTGDVTAELIGAEQVGHATLIVREPAVLCGIAWFEAVYAELCPDVSVVWQAGEGTHIEAGQEICTIDGPTRAILSGERTALNFLQCLSGTASVAASFAAAVTGTPARILDTRKTLPGLRSAQKYATACGGCTNHRMGLYDAVLIKENHILGCGSIASAVTTARQLHPGLKVEVEVESLAELVEAVDAGADWIMLDNFEVEAVERAVGVNAGRAKLEVSGNMDIACVSVLARTGVDFISVGALTKHVHAVDFSLRLAEPPAPRC